MTLVDVPVDTLRSVSPHVPPGEPRHGVRLLDVDPELGAGLPADELAEARQYAVLPMVTIETGTWEVAQLRQSERVRGDMHGFLVLEGMLTFNLSVAGRTCARLLTARDLMLVDELGLESEEVTWSCSVLARAQLAILDERLLAIATHWPRLLSAILKRAARQTASTLLQQAISQLPRVEDRLLALMRTIAQREGVARPDGIFIALAATHDTLAHMIGAQRPTVSLGLTHLAEQGRLRPEPDGWTLASQELEPGS